MTGAGGARVRRAALFVLAFVVLVALWEGYKAVGPAGGGKLFGWRILPRTEDSAMPHFWDVLSASTDPNCAAAIARSSPWSSPGVGSPCASRSPASPSVSWSAWPSPC